MAEKISRLTQFLLAHGCVTSEELFDFLSLLREDTRSQLTDENIARSIEVVNNKLKMFNMMIRSAYNSKTRKRHYALISTVDNAITRQASHHTEKEFEYFRLIWLELQEGPGDLNRFYSIGRDLKLTNYKDLIQEWTRKHWLLIEGGEVFLGPRANLELDVLAKMSRPSTSSSGTQQLTSRIQEDDDED